MRMFTGLGTALITPFAKGGDEIDWNAFEKLVETQLTSQVDFLVPCGTTGESPTLTVYEHSMLIKRTVELAKGKSGVLAGAGSNCTKEAVNLTSIAKHHGANGVLVVSPYYNRPSPAGIKHYYETIAKVGLPVVLYDIPKRTGQGVSAELILELAHNGTICGIKWASGDYKQLTELLINRPKDFTVLSGDDSETYNLLRMGGDGVVSVLSNILPELKYTLSLASCQDWTEIQEDFEKFKPLLDVLFIEPNPVPIKHIMSRSSRFPGLFNPAVRSPLVSLTKGNLEKIDAVLRNTKLI